MKDESNSNAGMVCNDPFCITCPIYDFDFKVSQQKVSRTATLFDSFHSDLYGEEKGGWTKKFRSFWCFLLSCISGVVIPHTKKVQIWNKFFVISCLVSIFLDPLFFFLFAVQEDNKCIFISRPLTTTLVVFRSMTDFIYFLHLLLQFRWAYVVPETKVDGSGQLVNHPKKNDVNYGKRKFFVDLLVVFPMPQIIVLLVLPKSLGTSGANYAKNLLRTAIILQCFPRLYRFLPLLGGQSPSGFVFETEWANFVINLFTFMLASHFVGSFWYLFGLQLSQQSLNCWDMFGGGFLRVNRCFRDACNKTGTTNCLEFIDCGHGDGFQTHRQDPMWSNWSNNENATACFSKEGFNYGIFLQAVNLTTENSIISRYSYSLFWGFQQISTLAGNLVPSYYVYEVYFTMGIIGLGLLLFALLIGNMQNFLQALGKRRLEMSLRRRDVEQWMEHHHLPEKLKRQVRDAERYCNWTSTRGVEKIFENFPEDLQRNIRRQLFKFVKKVRIFACIDYEPVLDGIRERLRRKIFVEGSEVFTAGDIIENMVFIVRGKMESRVDGTGFVVPLSEGDVCGEELLTWCLEHSSMNKYMKRNQNPTQKLVSTRTVKCLSKVEAFSLRASDLEEVARMFSKFLRNPRVLGAIRYESPYWRSLAATSIQVSWRYRKRRLLDLRIDNLKGDLIVFGKNCN